MVENYFNQELLDITFEESAKDEWKELVAELGISGQDKVMNGDAKSAIPFPFMNVGMTRVYETLCPNKQPYTQYDKTPIPLEVLKQISFCKKDNLFKSIEIWSDTKTPDPIVVGCTFDWVCFDIKDENGSYIRFNSQEEAKAHPDYQANAGIYKHDEKQYLVARWGDELKKYADLKALAISRKIDVIGYSLKKTLKEAQEKISALEQNVGLFIEGELSEYQIK